MPVLDERLDTDVCRPAKLMGPASNGFFLQAYLIEKQQTNVALPSQNSDPRRQMAGAVRLSVTRLSRSLRPRFGGLHEKTSRFSFEHRCAGGGDSILVGGDETSDGQELGTRPLCPPPLILKSKYKTIYDQTGNDAGVGTISQNFESTFDAYDSQAADDFTVPAGETWTVFEVDVVGRFTEFSGSFRHANSENVFFYQDSGGLPGDLIHAFPSLKGTGSENGSFAIPLSGKGLALKTGHYWISVQIGMDAGYGEWFWDNQTTTEGDPAAWQNPGNGFGTGCTTWEPENECFGTKPGNTCRRDHRRPNICDERQDTGRLRKRADRSEG